MMSNVFWFDFKIEDFLFKGLSINSIFGFIVLCAILVVLSIAFEGLKLIHVVVKTTVKKMNPETRPSFFSSQDSTTLLANTPEYSKRTLAVYYMLEVFINSVQSNLNYILMLAVMTFNGYLMAALALGGTLGYYFFGQSINGQKSQFKDLVQEACQQCIQGHTSVEAASRDEEGFSEGRPSPTEVQD